MTFESVFQDQILTPVCLTEDKDASIHLITEKPFYITPSLTDLRTNKNSRLIVISAPGGTMGTDLRNERNRPHRFI